MQDLADIVTLFKQFKSEEDKQTFISKQHQVITDLLNKNKVLEEKITHLEQLIISTHGIQRSIVTPEEALIDSQIAIIQNRSFGQELTLEDVKKLDILLKNKKIIKSEPNTFDADSKRLSHSNAELIAIVSKKDGT